MKKHLILFFVALLSITTVMAQPPREPGIRPRFNPEQFKAQMDSYIKDKAGLTQAEADKVFPIFHELKEKQVELSKKVHKLKSHESNKSTKDYSSIVQQITNLNVQSAKLEQTYYAKMCKVIDAQKVLEIMRAEDTFHREMLRKADGRGPAQGPKRPAPRPKQ